MKPVTVSSESFGGSTVYRGSCPSCGFATIHFSDPVWASVVCSRHRCGSGEAP